MPKLAVTAPPIAPRSGQAASTLATSGRHPFVAFTTRGYGQDRTSTAGASTPTRPAAERVTPPRHGDPSRADGLPAYAVAVGTGNGAVDPRIPGAPFTTINSDAKAARAQVPDPDGAAVAAVAFPDPVKSGRGLGAT